MYNCHLVEFSKMADEYSCMPSNSEINIPSATIEYEVVDSDRAQSSPSRSCAYETIQPEKLRIQIQHAEKKEGDPSSPLSEFSTYHNPYTDEDIHTPGIISKLSGTGSLRAKHAHTRQLNIFIGEELEDNFQRPEFPSERRAYSCPPTPRAAKRAAHPLVRESLEPTQMGAEGSRYEDEPMHFFIYNLPEEEPSTYNEFLVKSNPYNKINHMIHSALHCPCFFFFFLLCCMPGVHWMQVGDDAYKNGDVDEAKSLGRKATVSYFIGAVLGVLVLTGVIMISVYFVQDQLVQ